MDIRMRYLSALKSSSARTPYVTPARKIIRRELMEWILFREYLDPASDMGCVADRLGVPREDVSDLLWICTGERFLTIRKRLRIGDAKRLLLSRPDMTMSEVARTVGFQDKSDFRRAFKEETGYTYNDYLNRFRILKSMDLLEDDQQKIYQIADEVGIGDYKYFVSVFEKYTGMTPTNYRKEVNQAGGAESADGPEGESENA